MRNDLNELSLARRTITKISKEDKSNTKNTKQNKGKINVSNSQSKKNNERKSCKTQGESFKSSSSKSRFPCTLLDNEGQKDTNRDNTEKLERQIKAFLNDPTRSELVFSTDLTSHERFTVHRLAEEFGLEHASKGTGEERFIAVAKKPTSDYGKLCFYCLFL